ncbi:nuclear transport factor 2 family protein [Hyphobacterium sp.]|uniref:nuclear transport factor 2 family protein n=1 Tax=Hyphobacterium sp. TaxID=2004662 RepID=UPI003BA9AEE1
MSEYPEALDHMLAAWNEADASLTRGHLDQALAPDVRFVDPSIDLTGVEDFEANVHAVRGNLPGAVYSRTSGVDGQNGFYRYHWAIHQGGQLLIEGFDVTEVNAEGRIAHVIGFFGPIPALS